MADPEQEMFQEPAELLLPIKEASLAVFPPELIVQIFKNLNGKKCIKKI